MKECLVHTAQKNANKIDAGLGTTCTVTLPAIADEYHVVDKVFISLDETGVASGKSKFTITFGTDVLFELDMGIDGATVCDGPIPLDFTNGAGGGGLHQAAKTVNEAVTIVGEANGILIAGLRWKINVLYR